MKSSKKKDLFLQQFSMGFNVTDSCQKSGVGRASYYRWLEKDKNFKRACLDVEQSLIDHVESEMLKLIDKGDSSMIRWFLEHRAADRGWVTKQEVEHSGQVEIRIVEELVDNGNEKGAQQ